MISKPTTVLGWAKLASTAFAAMLVLSWVAGQCRTWRTPHAPKAPPAIPGAVDPGTPVAGPTTDRPTTSDPTGPIARPALSREELLAEAAKFGLELAPRKPKPSKPPQETQETEKPAAVADQAQAAAANEVQYPIFFGKERFSMKLHGSSEVALEVSAWQLEPGAKIDLRGKWEDYQPPAPAPATVATCPGGDGFFGNEARWEKEIAAGAIGTADGFGPGGSAALTYRGPRTGAANWGATARVMGGKIGTKTPFMGLAAARVSW